jgi:hypothetical protein
MLNLDYSLIIEATADPEFFGFFSEELEGFSGIGHSVEDCLYRARHGMREHVALMRRMGMKPPPANRNPRVLIINGLPKGRRSKIPKVARRHKAVA